MKMFMMFTRVKLSTISISQYEIFTIVRKALEFVGKFTKNFVNIKNEPLVKKTRKNKNKEKERDNERINNDDKNSNKSLRKSGDNWTENFLTDEPILRDLLLGIPTEHDLFDIVCTINQLLFYYLIVRDQEEGITVNRELVSGSWPVKTVFDDEIAIANCIYCITIRNWLVTFYLDHYSIRLHMEQAINIICIK
ncbi:hypothetical protein V1478_008913 [Vespula squamosa]|uniref:Uncharacterized protein n=1 Tax=Vespula squamosa TaxID=30214 RepID=A0ABD2AXJ6_VESSQ